MTAIYIGNGQFSLCDKAKGEKKINAVKGGLFTVRFVKFVNGKGVTVQYSQDQFGFVPICEITDDLNSNVVKYISEKAVFAARVIDFDPKANKPIFSARESVVDEASWSSISPSGSSIAFKEHDEQRQTAGNLRNKILKYGADVALSRGDLAVGYVTGIGKAGCFV